MSIASRDLSPGRALGASPMAPGGAHAALQGFSIELGDPTKSLDAGL